jgi:hypothetical protein
VDWLCRPAWGKQPNPGLGPIDAWQHDAALRLKFQRGDSKMATMIEVYQARKSAFDAGMRAAKPGPAQIWRHQELLYRIVVLETCQMFVNAAPESVDVRTLFSHYQMVDAYVQNLVQERRGGPVSDQGAQSQRDAAHVSLCKIIQDYRSRFSSFAPGNDPGRYRAAISNVMQTVLPAWLQYRQTYIEIKKEAD